MSPLRPSRPWPSWVKAMLFLVFGTAFDLGLAFAYEASHGAVAWVIGIAMFVFGLAFVILAAVQGDSE